MRNDQKHGDTRCAPHAGSAWKVCCLFYGREFGDALLPIHRLCEISCRLAILSRKPLENVKIHYFNASRYGYGALAAEIKITDQRLLLCSLHLDRILQVSSRRRVSGFTTLRVFKKEIFSDTVRSRSVEEVLEWLSGFDTDYSIIGGDFNTFPLSKPIRKMTEKLQRCPLAYYGLFHRHLHRAGSPI